MLQVGLRYSYPSDLSDQQWKLIQSYLPSSRGGGRPRKTCIRRVANAIFYVVRTGCAWRCLPKDFPPWQTVYGYYRAWREDGILEKIHGFLVAQARISQGRDEAPSELVVDSQSVKASFGEALGYDGFKKVRGRKRSILVDTIGLIHAITIHPANSSDGHAAVLIQPDHPHRAKGLTRAIKAIYADGGYRGRFEGETLVRFGFCPTYRRSLLKKDGKGAKSIMESNLRPKRWVVERTFGWMNNYRRLVRDYERSIESSRAMVFLGMTQLLLRRLCRAPNSYKRW